MELTLAKQELCHPEDGAQKEESLCSLKTVVQGASFVMLNPEFLIHLGETSLVVGIVCGAL